MKTILLTFDIEEFPAKEFDVPITVKEAYSIGHEGTKKILRILKENRVPATCFVTYEFARRYKKILEDLERIGCEIASHGFNHEHRYNKMSEKNALIYLKKSKKGMKRLGFNVKGFRAPQMSKPRYEIIKKAGFEYDSSLHPAWVPGYYNNFFEKRNIQRYNKLKIVPLSVVPLIKFPMAWIWFRNFGLFYEKISTKLNFIDMDFTNIYLHPWEFIDVDNEINKRYMSRLIVRNTGEKFANILDNYIKWGKSKNYKFSTIKGYLK